MSQKFSIASDVWSYGITCVEIFQDGAAPYPLVPSNPAVITLVTTGGVHPCPLACPEFVYATLARCWALEPEARPAFEDLVAFFGGITDSSAALADAAGSPGASTGPTMQRARTLQTNTVCDGTVDLSLGAFAEPDGPGNYDLGHQAEEPGVYDLGHQDAISSDVYDLGHTDADGPDAGHRGRHSHSSDELFFFFQICCPPVSGL